MAKKQNIGLRNLIIVAVAFLVITSFSGQKEGKKTGFFGCSNSGSSSNINKLNVGDCVDLGEYDDALRHGMTSKPETTRYCKIAGNIQPISPSEENPNEYSFDLQQPCITLACDFIIPLNLDRVPEKCRTYTIDRANNIDGKIVSDNLCN